MKITYKILIALAVAFSHAGAVFAQEPVMNLWPSKAPGKVCEEEEVCPVSNGDSRYKFVSVPTLTFYGVKSETPAPIVLVCPGGGYDVVCVTHEGVEIAKWLNQNGIAAAVLKYRVPKNRDGAFADAQRALRIIRANAQKWGVDAGRVGMLGFSAGGHLTARTSTGYNEKAYEPVDEIDKLSARPDFTVLVYPAYLYADKNYTLVPEVSVDKDTPQAFITMAQDDKTYFDSSIAYYLALKKAGVKADLHLFADGGHGKGVRRNKEPMKDWPKLCAEWINYYFGEKK